MRVEAMGVPENPVYHCVSRVVEKRMAFGEREKRMFTAMMRKYETFCGVQVLAFCVMGNHFHILVEVPPKEEKGAPIQLSDEEFLRRIKALYSEEKTKDLAELLGGMRERGKHEAAESLKNSYTYRMHDLSEFFKGLKQRFTQWFNSVYEREGTLWEGRFRSVLVECGYAARVVAAYIDLNPVRAGISEKPEEYAWSSYGQAVGAGPQRGKTRARRGLCRVMSMGLLRERVGGKETARHLKPNNKLQNGDLQWHQRWVGWKKNASRSAATSLSEEVTVAEMYRMMLYADGEEVFVRCGSGDVKRVRKGFSRAEVERVLAEGGKLSLGQALRCRIRYFTDGMALGSREFTDRVFDRARWRFGEKRKDGARLVKNIAWSGQETQLFSMRNLVKRPISE